MTLAILGLYFPLYQGILNSRAVIKNDQLNNFIKWQHMTQKLSCYYSHAKDKSVFSKELSTTYSEISGELDGVLEKLKSEVKELD